MQVAQVNSHDDVHDTIIRSNTYDAAWLLKIAYNLVLLVDSAPAQTGLEGKHVYDVMMSSCQK